MFSSFLFVLNQNQIRVSPCLPVIQVYVYSNNMVITYNIRFEINLYTGAVHTDNPMNSKVSQ